MNRRIRDAIRHVVRPAASRPADVWVPLADAARALQTAQRGSDLDRISFGLAESDDALVAFWALRVAEAGVQVYGARIMASRSQPVPVDALRTGRLLHGATRLSCAHSTAVGDICALQVRRQDLAACLRDAATAGAQDA